MYRESVLAASLALAATAAGAQTVDELVAKSIEARGGLAKLQSLQTARFTGKMTMGPMEVPVVMEVKRPNRMRMEMTIQGLAAVQAYDGKVAWGIPPMGSRNPQLLPPEMTKEMDEQADVDGPLVDWKKKGHTVELVGKEAVEGTDAYKLKITLKSGDVRYVYLDAESYMEIKSEGKRTVRGTEVEGESTMGDFKEVGGIMFPHAIEGGMKGNPQRQKITIDKIEVNVPIDDARFKMPEVKPEPAPAASPAPKAAPSPKS